MLRTLSKMIVCLGMVLATQGFASAAVISTLRNTGWNAAGTVLLNHNDVDTNFTATLVPSGSSTLVAAVSGIPGTWLGNNSTSRWISAANPGNDPAGAYTIKQTFSLTGFNHLTASFSGRWASDNGATMWLNGTQISSTLPAAPGTNTFSAWKSFSATSGFLSGLNTIEYRITNNPASGGVNPMGLRVEFQNSFVAVPLPASLALLLTGIPGLAMVRRRIARQK